MKTLGPSNESDQMKWEEKIINPPTMVPDPEDSERIKKIYKEGEPRTILFRTAVPGGWLVLTESVGAITYIPDSSHSWKW